MPFRWHRRTDKYSPVRGLSLDYASSGHSCPKRSLRVKSSPVTPRPLILSLLLTFAACAENGETLNPESDHAHTNRLAKESSPYLLQHAHNPVDWFPWGDEAFAKALAEDKPVFLSIGYSTCHWCHVMERESFEDLEIARYINENYIAIKVDREERPDVDSIYMSAVQAMTRRGGWPMTVWLTSDAKPLAVS